jgi:hypothetical protein
MVTMFIKCSDVIEQPRVIFAIRSVRWWSNGINLREAKQMVDAATNHSIDGVMIRKAEWVCVGTGSDGEDLTACRQRLREAGYDSRIAINVV